MDVVFQFAVILGLSLRWHPRLGAYTLEGDFDLKFDF